MAPSPFTSRVAFTTVSGNGRLVPLRRGTLQITLDCPTEGHGRNACVSLRVNSADECYDGWRAKIPVLRCGSRAACSSLLGAAAGSVHPAEESALFHRQFDGVQVGLACDEDCDAA